MEGVSQPESRTAGEVFYIMMLSPALDGLLCDDIAGTE
jgi:hypothetical protein